MNLVKKNEFDGRINKYVQMMQKRNGDIAIMMN